MQKLLSFMAPLTVGLHKNCPIENHPVVPFVIFVSFVRTRLDNLFTQGFNEDLSQRSQSSPTELTT
jgi:hypothetical protein